MSIDLKTLTRATEWWDYKLAHFLTLYYSTIFLFDQPILLHGVQALVLLLALVPGAAYVSLLNDITDLDDDRAAGKPNNMEGRSKAFRAALLVPTLAAGALVLFFWRDDPLLVASYLAAWVAFGLYSLPPIRLKKRGVWGVLADACGAHLFPTSVAILLAFRAVEQPVDGFWLMAGLAWGFGYGLRGILWHQNHDRPNDEVAGVRTFAVLHPDAAVWLGLYVAFPLELVGLSLLLWTLGDPLSWLFLSIYLVTVFARIAKGGTRLTVVGTKPPYLILMQEYYDSLFPLGVLIASSMRFPVDWAVFAIHMLLFPRRTIAFLGGVWSLVGRPGNRAISRWRRN